MSIDCVLIARPEDGRWMSLLAGWGFPSRLVTPEEIGELTPLETPGIVFFDLAIGPDARVIYQETVKQWKSARPVTIALLPSSGGIVARADLIAAGSLQADEFLVSESPAAVVAARIHYTFLKYGGLPGGPTLPKTSWSQMSSVPIKGRPGTVYGIDRAVRYLSANRDLSARITDAISHTKPNLTTALALVNIDRFNRIITHFGKERSEHILEELLTRIRTVVSAQMSAIDVSRLALTPSPATIPAVFRIGPKEFVVLFPNIVGKSEARDTVNLILEAVSDPLETEGQPIYLAASAGIAFAPEDAHDSGTLLSAAHSAVSAAKQRAGNSIAFYTPHMSADETHRMDTEHRLRQAMASSELEMYYQPQVCVRTGQVKGLEALVRWNHPDLGLVSPESFIPIAEEAGITVDLGCWAIRTAITEIMKMQALGLANLHLSVNVSADMFAGLGGEELTHFLTTALADAGMPARQLTLEITERTIVDDDGNAPRVIDELKALGIRLALDDFGTGYSSLSYLKALPIDELKIDRSFIVGNDKEDRALLQAIISMANTLNMTVVAEGVETREQLVRLYEQGCDVYQGYLCSPPVPAKDLLKVVGSTFADFSSGE